MEHHIFDPALVSSGAILYGLVRDLSVAGQLVKISGKFGLKARNCDRADKLFENIREQKPFLIVLDFENCEMESYKALKELKQNADFKGVPVIGFVTQSRVAVKGEAERSGCDRVYMKTEFAHELPALITRYAK